MDLSAEAAACESIGAFLQPLGVRTPAFYWDQVGRRINVQERHDGVPVRAILDAAREGGADVAGKYADAVLRMIIFNGRRSDTRWRCHHEVVLRVCRIIGAKRAIILGSCTVAGIHL